MKKSAVSIRKTMTKGKDMKRCAKPNSASSPASQLKECPRFRTSSVYRRTASFGTTIVVDGHLNILANPVVKCKIPEHRLADHFAIRELKWIFGHTSTLPIRDADFFTLNLAPELAECQYRIRKPQELIIQVGDSIAPGKSVRDLRYSRTEGDLPLRVRTIGEFCLEGI